MLYKQTTYFVIFSLLSLITPPKPTSASWLIQTLCSLFFDNPLIPICAASILQGVGYVLEHGIHLLRFVQLTFYFDENLSTLIITLKMQSLNIEVFYYTQFSFFYSTRRLIYYQNTICFQKR